MENSSILDYYAYGSNFVDPLIQKANSLKFEKGESLEYKDFNSFDMLHPNGHFGVDQFLKKNPLDLNSKILDVGIGLGGTSRYLSVQKGFKVFGFDYSPDLVRGSQHFNTLLNLDSQIQHIQGDACTINLPQTIFDAAICIGVFVHIQDEQSIFNTVKALKTGGLLYIEDYYFVKQRENHNQEDRELINNRKMYGVRTQEQMKEILGKSGCQILEIAGYGEEVSEAVWNRAEFLLENHKLNAIKLTEEDYHQMLNVSPQLTRSLKHFSEEELLQKYSNLQDLHNIRDLVFNNPLLTSFYRVVAKKL